MFKKFFNRNVLNEQNERDRLNNLSEKELLIDSFIIKKRLTTSENRDLERLNTSGK